ncbi:uncharacterized protein ASPGLDRAFT_40355 [Aspergillus glaucus CBS 516.65]|uniref:Uncharacterized protein n=1 Tax=Aspergillus glaucus CBS 516.65 TaxID=1160497 RepID=A0A1L9V4W6_ASPGL|nr:hypothetical protein ASPGLDRAFT_40355 [Aspergillus glaucus CBS 516.65]OJJ78968.1 hypothetical protein ASPGLDRAFT_40355 [Aspergillus glaucus CBS 516.65]
MADQRDCAATRSDNQPYSKEELVDIIIEKLDKSTEEETLEIHDVDISTAWQTIDELERHEEGRAHRTTYDSLQKLLKLVIAPCLIHQVHFPWLSDQIKLYSSLTFKEKNDLRILPSPRFENFQAPYTASRKEPDQCILPAGKSLPTVVIESGWSETKPQLYRDRDLWLKGGVGNIQVVIILKWNADSERKVKGDIELYDLDNVGNIRCISCEAIFPCPPAEVAATQNISLTKDQLFGPNLSLARNDASTIDLNVDGLREIAAEYIGHQGYTPM